MSGTGRGFQLYFGSTHSAFDQSRMAPLNPLNCRSIRSRDVFCRCSAGLITAPTIMTSGFTCILAALACGPIHNKGPALDRCKLSGIARPVADRPRRRRTARARGWPLHNAIAR